MDHIELSIEIKIETQENKIHLEFIVYQPKAKNKKY